MEMIMLWIRERKSGYGSSITLNPAEEGKQLLSRLQSIHMDGHFKHRALSV
uniref:Uncharacterized protein n=1 Tax=Anguilla anguilla TaxID=7936 RepID=A0A0E9RCR2_ANGAN